VMLSKTKNTLGGLLVAGLALILFSAWVKLGFGLVVFSVAVYFWLMQIIQVPKPVSAEDIIQAGGKSVKLKDGRLLEYFEVGQSDHYPILYVHGGAMTGRSIFAIDGIEQFAKRHRLRFISISLPGQGLSDYKANWRLVDFPADVAQLLNVCLASPTTKVAVTGWSVGGNVALALARSAELSARVEHVMAMAPSCGGDYDSRSSMRFRPFMARLPIVQEFLCHKMASDPSMFRNAMRSQKDNGELMDPANKTACDWIFADVVRCTSWSKAEAMLTLSVVDEPFGFDPNEIRQAAEGRGRVLIASGLRDGFVPPIHQRVLADRIAGAELVEFAEN